MGISMIETMRDFIEKIDALGIEYMVTGSYAMGAYGEIRMTRDVDVIVQFGEKHIAPFLARFKDQYYVDEMSVRRAIGRRSMFNIISQVHGGKIDCIIQKDTDFARASFARRYRESVAGVNFWTTTKEDLIVAKLDWARDTYSEMQIRDIANLTGSEYDSDYVNDWIQRMNLDEIWSKVERWKTRRKQQDN